MRRPNQPDDKKSPDEKQPPGGRAWQRVKDFERARGLPTQSTPGSEDQQDDTDDESDSKKKADS